MIAELQNLDIVGAYLLLDFPYLFLPVALQTLPLINFVTN
jgi:hypothetical protein